MKKLKTLCIAFLILLFSSSFQSPRITANPSTPNSIFPIIDVHTHTRFTGKIEPITHIMQSEKEYFREWNEAGVVGAIAHTGESGENYHDLKSQHVLHCAGTGPTVDVTRIEKGLKSGKYGCIKIYLGYVYQWAYDENYFPAYRLAEKFNVPVVFHTGDTYSTTGLLKYADPMTIDEVAVKFPKVKFVIAHVGNPWIESAAEVTYKNPNVYVEVSALLIGNLSQLPPEQVEEYVVKPIRWAFGYIEDPKKILFGTDWPLNDIAAYADAVKRAIPEEHWNAVFYDNAMSVFSIPGLPKTAEEYIQAQTKK